MKIIIWLVLLFLPFFNVFLMGPPNYTSTLRILFFIYIWFERYKMYEFDLIVHISLIFLEDKNETWHFTRHLKRIKVEIVLPSLGFMRDFFLLFFFFFFLF